MPYAIIVTGRETRAALPDKPIVGEEDQKYWVVNEPEGYVSATSCWYSIPVRVPTDIKWFKTAAAAETFAKNWKGHPWWCSPKSFEVVKIKPLYERMLKGWKLESDA